MRLYFPKSEAELVAMITNVLQWEPRCELGELIKGAIHGTSIVFAIDLDVYYRERPENAGDQPVVREAPKVVPLKARELAPPPPPDDEGPVPA